MIHAYDRLYIEKARTALASMLDYSVYDLEYDLTSFFELFLVSNVSSSFECGDPSTIAGRSGIELACEVLDQCGVSYKQVQPSFAENRSKEYWTGWALAYYQWETALSFYDIVRYVPITEIRSMYSPYHEMDIRQFTDHMDELINAIKPDTNLKTIRQKAGLSQSQLASISGIPLRTIQQYEQRQKNINKAQAEYLIRLSTSLGCNPVKLLEKN